MPVQWVPKLIWSKPVCKQRYGQSPPKAAESETQILLPLQSHATSEFAATPASHRKTQTRAGTKVSKNVRPQILKKSKSNPILIECSILALKCGLNDTKHAMFSTEFDWFHGF